MKTSSHKLFVVLGLLSLSLSFTAQAAESDIYSLETIESSDGFVTEQPTISAYKLERVLEDADLLLKTKLSVLEKNASDHRDASNNYILAAVMPGGLLYLAYHKAQLSSAEDNLVLVQQSQQEMMNDRTRLQLDAPVNIQLARFP